MKRLLLALLLIPLCAPLLAANLTVQTELAIPLSLAQEAENAIDRAQRWIRSQPCECTNATETLLHKYALLPKGEKLSLSERDLTLLEKSFPPAILPTQMKELPEVIALLSANPKALFALQQQLPTTEAPSGWRETFVQTLINTQKATPAGGYWQDPHATLWAILTLRSLLNEPNPIEVTPPATSKL